MNDFQVDLDRFAANLAVIAARIAPAAHMLVVKDDAYAHGLEPIVMRAWSEGVRWFGAFDVATGQAVRAALGPDARIFVWLVAGSDDAAAAVAAGLDIGVGDAHLLEHVADVAADANVLARVHLKVDSGLHRNGVRPEQWRDVIARVAELEKRGVVQAVGIWSHIGEASDADDDDARQIFETAVDQARTAGLAPEVLHLAASAASFERPEFRYDMARIGAYAYGIRPAGGPAEDSLEVEPIGALTTSVLRVDPSGVTIDLGSLDGLPSSLAGRMRVHASTGQPTVLAIGPTTSMLEPWPGAAAGDPIVVFGGAGAPTATDLAESIGSIGEEIVLRVSPLIRRSYR